MGLTWPPSVVAVAVQRCGRKCGGAIEDAAVRLKPRDASSGGGQRENCTAGRQPRPINRRLAPIAGSTCTLQMLKMMMLMHITSASAAAAAAAGKQEQQHHTAEQQLQPRERWQQQQARDGTADAEQQQLLPQQQRPYLSGSWAASSNSLLPPERHTRARAEDNTWHELKALNRSKMRAFRAAIRGVLRPPFSIDNSNIV